MLALYAELQVAGQAVAVATFSCDVERPIDFQGKPSSVPHYQPIWVTLEGLDIPAFFAEWAIDSCLRRSGWLVVYEGDRVRWKLAFYDAWCVLYHENFRPGIEGQAACQLSLEISAQLWEWNGIEIEHHSDLWWEKDQQVRKRALTPPSPILAPPNARKVQREANPIQPLPQLPTPSLSAQQATPPKKKRKKKPKSPYSGKRPIAPKEPVLSNDGKVNEYGKWYYQRPFTHRQGVRNEAFNGAKENDGNVYDPLTKSPIAPSDSWDMGHKPGYEFRKHQLSAAQRSIERKKFVDEHNVPGHYRPELPSSNRSHQEEDLTDLFLGGS